MKFIYQIIITALIAFVLQSFLPWWTMAIAAAGIGYYFNTKGLISFAAGFLGVGLLWLGMALFIDVTTHSILTEKINRILPLNSVVLTALIGGIVGGFASLTGALIKSKM